MDKLEEIKEAIAREKGFADYSDCLLQHTNSFGDLDCLIDEITKRYTSECIKASLLKASENAEGYRDYDFCGVDSDTIINEENIVLL